MNDNIIIDGPGSKLEPPPEDLFPNRERQLLAELDAHLEAIDAARAPDSDPFLLEQAEEEFHSWVRELVAEVSE